MEGAAPVPVMGAEAPLAAPSLDKEQFSTTLRLKALRLQASQCQEFVKALKGCAAATPATACRAVGAFANAAVAAFAGTCWTRHGSSL